MIRLRRREVEDRARVVSCLLRRDRPMSTPERAAGEGIGTGCFAEPVMGFTGASGGSSLLVSLFLSHNAAGTDLLVASE